MTLKNLNIDKTWSLFLDRDGVINKQIPNDYVKKWAEFEFLPGVLEALPIFNDLFDNIDDTLPDQSINHLLNDSNWQELMIKASNTLEELKKWN